MVVTILSNLNLVFFSICKVFADYLQTSTYSYRKVPKNGQVSSNNYEFVMHLSLKFQKNKLRMPKDSELHTLGANRNTFISSEIKANFLR